MLSSKIATYSQFTLLCPFLHHHNFVCFGAAFRYESCGPHNVRAGWMAHSGCTLMWNTFAAVHVWDGDGQKRQQQNTGKHNRCGACIHPTKVCVLYCAVRLWGVVGTRSFNRLMYLHTIGCKLSRTKLTHSSLGVRRWPHTTVSSRANVSVCV